MIHLLFIMLAAQAKNPIGRDYNVLSKWEEQEVKQAKQLLDKNLPAAVCGDSEWSIGLRRIVWGLKEAMPDKDFDVSSLAISAPTGKSPNDVTLCGVVSARAKSKNDESKNEEKIPQPAEEKPSEKTNP